MKSPIILSSLLLGSIFVTFEQPTISSENLSSHITATSSYRHGNATVKPVGAISIVIDKTDYELHVYDNKGWYATYPVVFGNNKLDDKRMEGDRNTPEGTFRINSKRVHDKWHRFMAIDYPTKESYEKFRRRKERGEIPSAARIGGAIGIHGTWPNEDYQIDRYSNWTLGCISMKNRDVQELYNYVTAGTKVTIKK
jgi:murein L,D-transpeptidase YafK